MLLASWEPDRNQMHAKGTRTCSANEQQASQHVRNSRFRTIAMRFAEALKSYANAG